MDDIDFNRRRVTAGMAITALGLTSITLARAANGARGGQGQGQPERPFKVIAMDPSFGRIIAPDAQLEPIITIPGVSGEGPVWRNGALWYSDQKGGSIYAVTPQGKSREVLKLAGGPVDDTKTFSQGPNAIVAYKDGAVLFCRQGMRDIAIMDKNGKVSPFLSTYEGKRFNSPNDMVIGHDGTLWFTDPPFSLPGWRGRKPGAPEPAARQIPFNGVFRYKDGHLAPVITDMVTPNGPGLSPDGRTFYVNNTAPGPLVRAYDVGDTGNLSNMRVIADFRTNSDWGRGYPDGLKVDSAGNVWTTGPGGIIIISPSGKTLGRIQTPSTATNMAFGERDYKSLFIVSGATVYRLRTVIKGQVPTYA